MGVAQSHNAFVGVCIYACAMRELSPQSNGWVWGVWLNFQTVDLPNSFCLIGGFWMVMWVGEYIFWLNLAVLAF